MVPVFRTYENSKQRIFNDEAQELLDSGTPEEWVIQFGEQYWVWETFAEFSDRLEAETAKRWEELQQKAIQIEKERQLALAKLHAQARFLQKDLPKTMDGFHKAMTRISKAVRDINAGLPSLTLSSSSRRGHESPYGPPQRRHRK